MPPAHTWWTTPLLAIRDLAVFVTILTAALLLADSLPLWAAAALAGFWCALYSLTIILSRRHHRRGDMILTPAGMRWMSPFLQAGYAAIACEPGCTDKPGHVHMAPPPPYTGLLTVWIRR
jgi:hypothetical protein